MYRGWTKDRLQQRLKSLQLPRHGTKAVLIRRLEDYDSADRDSVVWPKSKDYQSCPDDLDRWERYLTVSRIFNGRVRVPRVGSLSGWILKSLVPGARVLTLPRKLVVVSIYVNEQWHVHWPMDPSMSQVELKFHSRMKEDMLEYANDKAVVKRVVSDPSTVKDYNWLVIDLVQDVHVGDQHDYHSNSIVLDLRTQKGYFFEPHLGQEDDDFLGALSVQTFVKGYLDEWLGWEPQWQPPKCNRVLQHLGASTCQTWSYYYIVMRLLNPNLSERKLVDTMARQGRQPVLNLLDQIWSMTFWYIPLRRNKNRRKSARLCDLWSKGQLIRDETPDDDSCYLCDEQRYAMAKRGHLTVQADTFAFAEKDDDPDTPSPEELEEDVSSDDEIIEEPPDDPIPQNILDIKTIGKITYYRVQWSDGSVSWVKSSDAASSSRSKEFEQLDKDYKARLQQPRNRRRRTRY